MPEWLRRDEQWVYKVMVTLPYLVRSYSGIRDGGLSGSVKGEFQIRPPNPLILKT